MFIIDWFLPLDLSFFSRNSGNLAFEMSFLSFLDAHVPEGHLRWKGVGIPWAVA